MYPSNKISRKDMKELIDAGLSDKEVADILCCSKTTVTLIRTKELEISRPRRFETVDELKCKTCGNIFSGLSTRWYCSPECKLNARLKKYEKVSTVMNTIAELEKETVLASKILLRMNGKTSEAACELMEKTKKIHILVQQLVHEMRPTNRRLIDV